VGEKLRFGEDETGSALLEAEIIERGEYGERRLRFHPVVDFFSRLEGLGHIPLPPYISREDRSSDRERYQTVFARDQGSAAAPTAGLHFTPEILDQIRANSVEIVEVTLHVGLGTFQPLREEAVEKNSLHLESYEIGNRSAEALTRALQRGRGRVIAGRGETKIFIYPGFEFQVVGALLTNFHLPRSSLLMLVSAFAWREQVLKAYEHAMGSRYRFFSYGDCMLVE
jgi:S-adenosylmethionine:tRNA ribosyltransferase-isomerase